MSTELRNHTHGNHLGRGAVIDRPNLGVRFERIRAAAMGRARMNAAAAYRLTVAAGLADADAAARLPRETPRRRRVLVAEDDGPNQQVLRVMLERRGHSVRVVANGRLALEALNEETFDLLLLDMRMPEMDGWQVVKSLRRREKENPGCDRLPVIALTAMAQKSDRDRCREAGTDDYLPKPLRTAELYATLDRVLARCLHGALA